MLTTYEVDGAGGGAVPAKLLQLPKDFPLGDQRKLDMFHKQLENSDTYEDETPEVALANITTDVVRIVQGLAVPRRRKKCKDGWSPQKAATEIDLIMLVRLKRGIRGDGDRIPWTRWNLEDNLQRLRTDWRRKLRHVAKDLEQEAGFMMDSVYSLCYWQRLSRAEIDECIDAAIATKKRKLHGRIRTELRREFNAFCKKLEDERAEGRTGGAIRYLMGAKRGPPYRLEEVNVGGRLETDPVEIHRIGTDNFRAWMGRPPCKPGTIGQPMRTINHYGALSKNLKPRTTT
jgi:hypothetical protein